MLLKPRLKGYFTVVPTDKGWLLHGGENEMLRLQADAKHQQAFDVILPLLDGHHTIGEIVEAAQEQSLPPELVRGVIEKFAATGLVEEAATDLSAAEAEHFHDQLLYFGRFTSEKSGEALQTKLKQAAADVLVTGSLGAAVARQLQRLGIGRLRLIGEDSRQLESLFDRLEFERGNAPLATPEVVKLDLDDIATTDFDPESLLIVALERWNPTLLEEINARAVETQRPWMLVHSSGIKDGTVGPLFVPPHTACYACMESRLMSHMAFHTEYQEFREHLRSTRSGSRPWGSLEPATEALAGLAALEAVKHITEFATSKLISAFVNVDWFTLKMKQHHVLRVPRCLACRPPRVHRFPWKEAPVEPLAVEV